MNHCLAKSRIVLSLNLIFLISIFSKGEAIGQEMSLETISISNGLASPQVRALLQDDYGLIWLGTGNGIQSYNGFTWKTYRNIIGDSTSLQNNAVIDIAKDSLQNLWIGNEFGTSYYDRAKNIFKNYNFDSIFQTAGLGRTPSLLVDSQGRVWAGTLGFGILRFDPEKDTWVMAPYTQINGRESTWRICKTRL